MMERRQEGIGRKSMEGRKEDGTRKEDGRM